MNKLKDKKMLDDLTKKMFAASLLLAFFLINSQNCYSQLAFNKSNKIDHKDFFHTYGNHRKEGFRTGYPSDLVGGGSVVLVSARIFSRTTNSPANSDSLSLCFYLPDRMNLWIEISDKQIHYFMNPLKMDWTPIKECFGVYFKWPAALIKKYNIDTFGLHAKTIIRDKVTQKWLIPILIVDQISGHELKNYEFIFRPAQRKAKIKCEILDSQNYQLVIELPPSYRDLEMNYWKFSWDCLDFSKKYVREGKYVLRLTCSWTDKGKNFTVKDNYFFYHLPF